MLRNRLSPHENSQFLAVEKLALIQNQMYLFGVDEFNRSHKCIIHDFTPHFLIKWTDETRTAEDVVETLNDFLIDSLCVVGNSKSWVLRQKLNDEEEDVVNPVSHAQWEHRIPFYGFTNQRRDPMIRLYFKDTSTMNLCKQRLIEENYELYHYDWDPKLMLLHQTGLRYGDWISLPSGPPQSTHYVSTSQLVKQDRGQIPASLKCFIRYIAISQAAIHSNEPFRLPDPGRPVDRVIACTLDFAWTSMNRDEHVKSITLTLFNHEPNNNNNETEYRVCDSEEQLLEQIMYYINEYQPEDIIQCNDNGSHSTLHYLYQRAVTLAIHPNPFTKLDSFGKTFPYAGDINLHTRNCLDIAYFLKRKPFLPIEEYTLFEFASMKKVVKQKRVWNDMYWQRHLVNDWFRQGRWDMILHKLAQEVDIMRQVEYDLQMRVELYGIQKTNDTDFSDTANRGEQIRASNAIKYFLHHQNYYINSDLILKQQPLLVKLTDYPATFPPIDYIPLCEDLRSQCEANFAKLTPSKTVFKEASSLFQAEEEENDENEEDENACQGGNVVKPCPNHWTDEVIAVFDFASLYPNIMIRFNISHDCIVYEECYNNIENVSYITVPIDGVNGIRFAVTTPGIIAAVQRQSLAARKAEKALMEAETDPFIKSVRDFRQQSLKILCNAIYGALGARVGGFFLALKWLMLAVTSLGRYLQTRSSQYVAERYDLPTIYGDTDSIMPRMHCFHEQPTIELQCEAMAKFYKMPDKFNWDFVVDHFSELEDKNKNMIPWDLRVQPRKIQVNAILFLIMEKICKEIGDMFGAPIKLEPENIALNMWLTLNKKFYWYQCIEMKHPGKIKEIKCKGMPNKKRGWCVWVKNILDRMIDFQAEDKADQMTPFITSELDRLIQKRVPWQELVISSKYKGHFGEKGGYTGLNNQMLKLCTKIQAQTHQPYVPGARVKYIVASGPGSVNDRCVSVNHNIDMDSIPIDYIYYLDKQFYNNVKSLSIHHQKFVNVDRIYQKYINEFKALQNGQKSISILRTKPQ